MQGIQGLKVDIEKKSQSLQVNARELITSKREIERLNKMIKINDILHQKRLQEAKSNSTTHLSPCNKFLTVNSNIEPCSKTPKSAGSKSGDVYPLQSGIRKSQLNLKNQKLIEKLSREVRDSKLAHDAVVEKNLQIEQQLKRMTEEIGQLKERRNVSRAANKEKIKLSKNHTEDIALLIEGENKS